MANVKATKRRSIPHLEDIPSNELKRLISSINSSNASFSLKIDGAGFRFGKDIEGRKFCEGSRTGPIFERKAFSNYVTQKSGSKIQLWRALHYDDIFDHVMSSDLLEEIPEDTKVVCEVLYNPMAEHLGDALKFVKIPYKKKYLGSLMTLFPIKIVRSSDGFEYTSSENIIKRLVQKSNDRIKVLDPSVNIEHRCKDIQNSIYDAFKLKDAFVKKAEEKSPIGENIEGLIIKTDHIITKVVSDYYKTLK